MLQHYGVSVDTAFFPDTPIIQPTRGTLLAVLVYGKSAIPIIQPTRGSLDHITGCGDVDFFFTEVERAHTPRSSSRADRRANVPAWAGSRGLASIGMTMRLLDARACVTKGLGPILKIPRDSRSGRIP
jgi:hypothetical protein